MYVLVFKESLFDQMAPKYSSLYEKNPSGSYCRKISLASLEKLEKICRSICEISPDNEIPSPAYHYAGQAFGFKENAPFQHSDPFLLNAGLAYLLAMGWHLFLTEGIKEYRDKHNPVVEQAISIIKESQDRDIGLQELAVSCGVSASRLSRLFNEQIGLSIVDYKNKIKLEQFLVCLEQNPQYSISEACYQVGFGSYSQFYKIFQKNFGISPKAYFSQ
jgi:AraC-like DNA-binding protein